MPAITEWSFMIRIESLRTNWRLIPIATALAVALVAAGSIYLPPAIDWHYTFRPAARELLALRDPYAIDGFYYPAWALVPILPLAVLPENIGRALFFLLSLGALAYTGYRMGAKPLALAAFIGSPLVVHGVLNGNIDWLPILGFVLPPWLGMFFVVIKPQIGFVVAIFWVVEAWRKGRWREVLKVSLPTAIGLGLSFVIFGFWPQRFGRTLSFWWNASLWPMSIPVGLVLLVTSIRTRRIEPAMAAAPCLSPYVLFHSWAGALLAIATFQMEMLVAVAGLWLLVLIRAVG